MSDDEATTAMRFLAGEWPTPTMNEDQARVWRGHLAGWTLEAFTSAVMALVEGAARPFRPNPSEVLAELRAQARRRALSDPGVALPAACELPGVGERRRYVADCREALR